MFIRVKNVKKGGRTYEYAYLVNSKWRKRAKRKGMKKWPEHKYNKHIGRVYRFEANLKFSFEEFVGKNFEEFVNSNDIKDIYKKFLEYNLINSGFKEKDNLFFNENIIVDLNKLMVHCNGKEAVVKIGKERGYICSFYLEKLFKINSLNGRNEGMELMKKLKQVGANINSEKFYFIVNKLLS